MSQKDPSDSDGEQSEGGAPKLSRGWMGWVAFVAAVFAVLLILNAPSTRKEVGGWPAFRKIVQQGGVVQDSVVVKSRRVEAELKPGFTKKGLKDEETKTAVPVYVSIDGDHRDRFEDDLEELGVNYELDTGSSLWRQFFIQMVPILLIVAVIWFFVMRARQMGGGGPASMLGRFAKSQHKTASKERVEVTLDDVAGVDEAREEVEEIVQFLKDPKKFQRLGGRVPRGVLLGGPPGCGKTLLAKGIAGEADVPFFSISGSDFVEMFVGVGASRVRDLFKQAKESAPCIIFLDEIDAIGRKRSGGFTSGGANDEREQTLNAILSEMDGFDASDQVIVIAATNRQDVLDPALTRPGRFDRQVTVPLPDLVGRKQILEVHAQRVRLAPDVNLERLARGTPMFSGADLAALINEAAIIATMAQKDTIDMDDLEQARDKVRFGRQRKSRRMEEEERAATAYHEAGHALLQALLEDADPIDKVTIIPRGQAMGATFSLPEKERYGYNQRYLLATMRVLCGGRIAEHRKTNDASSGAAQDIDMVTRMAKHMVLDWGMSERLGFVRYSQEDDQQLVVEKTYSEDTARLIDQEIKRLADEAFADAERMIGENWQRVAGIAEALLKYETLTDEDVQRILAGEQPEKPTIDALIEEEQRKAAATEGADGDRERPAGAAASGAGRDEHNDGDGSAADEAPAGADAEARRSAGGASE